MDKTNHRTKNQIFYLDSRNRKGPMGYNQKALLNQKRSATSTTSEALANCKQDGSTIDDYFGRLTKIWDGIADCMTPKQCNCGKCECDLNSARDQETETLRVHDFLAGLDDATNGVIRSQICAISPLPDLDRVYQTVSQNEIIRSNITPEQPIMGFASQNRSPAKPTTSTRPINKDPTRQCTVCGRTGHEASGCFTIIGYPEWWEGQKNRVNNRPSHYKKYVHSYLTKKL